MSFKCLEGVLFISTFKCFFKRRGKLSGFSLKKNSNMDRVFLNYKDLKLIADGTQNDLLFNV